MSGQFDVLNNNAVCKPTFDCSGGRTEKETWGFTSTETIKAYYGRGSWWVGNFMSNT